MSSFTFKDVWEENRTDQALVDYLTTTLGMEDEALGKFYKNGKPLPTMESFLNELVDGAPIKILATKFLGHCATMSTQRTRKRKHNDHRRYSELPTPSGYGSVVKKTADGDFEGWQVHQEDPDLEVMCLRPPESTFISIALMHPVFAQVTDVLMSGEPEPVDWKMAAELATIMPRNFTVEGIRRDDVNEILNKYIARPENATIAPKIIAGTKESDGTAANFFNIEYKNEKGLGNADPYMENVGYYVHFWANRDGPTKHCCPWLMVEVVGQEMGLSGAAWACGYPCAQPLSSNVPFVSVPQDVHLRLMQGRLCMAMRVGFQQLNRWYTSQTPKLVANTQATFPFQREFSVNGKQVELVYKGILIPGLRRPLFIATRKDTGNKVVVKFSSQYGAEVHQELADCGMAPNIYAHLVVGGMVMVVMDYIESERWPDHPTTQQKKNLRGIAAKLKSTGFVHGDLRAPNILVQGDRVLAIDYDWAGRLGQVRYPIHLNQDEIWHNDACVGCAIEHSHDAFMVEQLCK